MLGIVILNPTSRYIPEETLSLHDLNPTSRYIPEETLSLHDFSEIVPRTEIDNNK